ncbi:MAG TPA: fatty acid desaturase [Actinomycetes bacterium]|nr:fatty acid desaturase [Actinomycetes bacterium]
MVATKAEHLTTRPDRALWPTLAELGLQLDHPGLGRQSYLLARPLAWFGLYWLSVGLEWWPLAILAIPAMFVTGVAVLNDLVHEAVGLGQGWSRLCIGVIAALMLENGAAVTATHLQHHFGKLEDWDPEGYIDTMKLPRLLLECPIYRYRLWVWAWNQSEAARTAILSQAAVHGFVIATAFLVPWTPLRLLVVVLVVAGLIFPLVSARGPQNAWGYGDPNRTIVRGRWVPRLLLGMTYHLEHHLYPEVPTYQLAELARRLEPLLVARGAQRVWTW